MLILLLLEKARVRTPPAFPSTSLHGEETSGAHWQALPPVYCSHSGAEHGELSHGPARPARQPSRARRGPLGNIQRPTVLEAAHLKLSLRLIIKQQLTWPITVHQ